MANDAGIPTLANMIMMGKMIKETGVVNFDDIIEALKKVVSAKRANLMDLNIKALEAGYNYTE
jgi:2-oxoglutarate ferredoxin oxidoreductase subunit gamma